MVTQQAPAEKVDFTVKLNSKHIFTAKIEQINLMKANARLDLLSSLGE